jgi:acyl-CoA thioester hydrolase
MTFQHTIQTRYSETAQDGIIHHPSYAIYLEDARIAFFHHLGHPINDLEKEGFLCPVVDLFIKYLKPLHSSETIKIIVSLEIVSKVRFSFHYQILRNDTLIALAKTSHCFTNQDMKPLPIPKKILKTN